MQLDQCIWDTELDQHPKVDAALPLRDRGATLLCVLGRVQKNTVDVVLLRHCDNKEADRHLNYWTMPCTGLFRLTEIGLDWYCDKENTYTERIEKAIIKEVEKYRLVRSI